MAFTYRWIQAQSNPQWDDMTATTKFNDVAVNDTTTFETATDTQEPTALPFDACQLVVSNAILTAQCFLGTAHSITSSSFVTSLMVVAGPETICSQSEDNPIYQPPPSAIATFATSTDGATWTTQWSRSVTLPTTGGVQVTTTDSESFPAVSACWTRLVIDYSSSIVTLDSGLETTVVLSDWRINGTDLGTSCGYPPSASCDIALSASVTPSTAAVGASGTFTVTATNNGPDATTATEVTILSPIGFNSPTYTPSQGTVTAGVWTIGAIAVGANKSCTIAGTIGRNGQLILSASVTGTTPDDVDTGDNYARATLVATPAAGTGCHCSEVHDGPCPTATVVFDGTLSGTFVFDGPCSGTWVVDDCPGGQPTVVPITWDTTDYKFDSTVVTFDMTEI